MVKPNSLADCSCLTTVPSITISIGSSPVWFMWKRRCYPIKHLSIGMLKRFSAIFRIQLGMQWFIIHTIVTSLVLDPLCILKYFFSDFFPKTSAVFHSSLAVGWDRLKKQDSFLGRFQELSKCCIIDGSDNSTCSLDRSNIDINYFIKVQHELRLAREQEAS